MTPGDQLGPIERGPITTRQLVEYAGASLDFNRIHYDEPFAKAGGFPSVIAHGMLSMGFFGELVARWAGATKRTLSSASSGTSLRTRPTKSALGKPAAIRAPRPERASQSVAALLARVSVRLLARRENQ